MKTAAATSRPVKGRASLYLSPTDYHYAVMRGMKQELAFRGGNVAAWQRTLRKKLKELIGVWPQQKVPLNVRSLWKRKHPLGTIEKIVFTSEPYADVIAYVCLPHGVRPPYSFFICLQGHSTGAHISIGVNREDETKAIDVEGDRDFGIGCMQRGVAALCIEQRAFGYRRELKQKQKSDHGCHDATLHALMLGRTLLGERVYDVERGLDYLEARGDVLMNRVGVMGNSGGGTISLFAAALLPRVAVAMPSCYFCTFADSIMSIYHCADNYVPNLFRYAEMADIMGLFAPRPVVLVAGKTDPIFPVKAVKRAFKHLKKIYAAAGAAEHCHLVIGPEGHRFYADLAWKKMLPEFQRHRSVRH